MKQLIKRLANFAGIDVVRYRSADGGLVFPPDASEDDKKILRLAAPFTMTGVERLLALVSAVRHVVRSGIPGGIAECGVWKGGSMMAVAETLLAEGDSSRELYLFDTFEGMTDPTDEDKTPDNTSASTHLKTTARGTGVWCYAGLEEVRANLATTKYPQQQIHFVEGPVETTIPSQAPTAPLALLRLDTDWYSSTKRELEYLFPLLSDGGLLIVDDYGHWQGCRKAVDEFLADHPKKYYLHRIDYTGRLLIK